MDEEIAQRLARVELEMKIDHWRTREKSSERIAKRGVRIMTMSLAVFVPTFVGGFWSFAIVAIGGAVTAAMFTYGGVLALFGSLSHRGARRWLREHAQLPEARVIR